MFVSYTQLNPVIEGPKFDVINLESFFGSIGPCYKKDLYPFLLYQQMQDVT